MQFCRCSANAFVFSQRFLIKDVLGSSNCRSLRNERQIVLVSLEVDPEVSCISDGRACTCILPCTAIIAVLNSSKPFILLSNGECSAAGHSHGVCSSFRVIAVKSLLVESDRTVTAGVRAILRQYGITFGYTAQSVKLECVEECESCSSSVRTLEPVSVRRPVIAVGLKRGSIQSGICIHELR